MTAEAPVDLLQDGLLRFDAPSTQAMEPTAAPAARPPAGQACARCHERAAERRCFQCERWFCKEDHWVMLGLCKECATPRDNAQAREPSRAAPDLGIKWIQE